MRESEYENLLILLKKNQWLALPGLIFVVTVLKRRRTDSEAISAIFIHALPKEDTVGKLSILACQNDEVTLDLSLVEGLTNGI